MGCWDDRGHFGGLPVTKNLTVLLLGSGAREHALASKLCESPLLGRLMVAPGNPGVAEFAIELDVGDHGAIIDWCQRQSVDLVVVGPEVPLVAGLADSLNKAGIACFGPSAAAARIEGSKAFARAFAARHGIPGPQTAVFHDVEAARSWLDEVTYPVVVKADGLAAGKGVVIPESRDETIAAVEQMMLGGSMGSAGSTVVLEERMTGPEVSLFAISSAHQTDTLGLLTAQDHKRVGAGDTGPNTGGMGAFAPVPGLEESFVAELGSTFLEPVTRGMAVEGTPYVGVIYAGIMLTPQGPRLVEFNCRFGDPETQILMPLIKSDLLKVFWAAANGLAWEPVVATREQSAAVVVVAADGYPADPIRGVVIPKVEVPEGVQLLHAGTQQGPDGLVSSGGRVLNVVATAPTLAAALARCYPVVEQLTGNGLFARPDIGWRHVSVTETTKKAEAYAASGVSLAAGAATTKRIGAAVTSTHDERVVAGLGSFGGVFDVSALSEMDEPLLVATTDGVGTKTVLAQQLDRWEGCGADIVNHGVNDVLVQGAKPLFFLDTVASQKLDPEIVGRIVDGMAEACRAAKCVLLGGETAEMPGVLTDGSVDIAGTLVGAVDRARLLPRPGIAPGHVLIGLASSGLHTNGFSLARRIVADMDLHDPLPGGEGESVGDALLAIHRSYLLVLAGALDEVLIDGLAHITGGGLVDNLPRILPDDVGAIVETASWTTPPLFQFLIDRAGLGLMESHQILNCGIGMVCVVQPDNVDSVRAIIPEETWIIGQLVDWDSEAGGGQRIKLR